MGFQRGQSGTEYLSNYTVAAAAVLIVIGALVYLGVLNPSQPDVCIFQKGLSCETHLLKQGNSMATLKIKNQFNDAIVISDVLCSAEPVNPSTGIPNRAWNSYEAPASNKPAVNSVTLPQPANLQPIVLAEESFELNVFCYTENGGDMKLIPSGERFNKGIVFIKFRLNSSPAIPGSSFYHVIQGNLQGKMN